MSVHSVIVVEDEPIILGHIVRKITTLGGGFNVIGQSYNGDEALDMIREMKPDIVVTDIHMPIMDGMELVKRVKQQFPDTVVVIISGYNEFDYAKQAIRYGVSEYLLKPINEIEFRETFTKIGICLDDRKSAAEMLVLIHALNGQTDMEKLPHISDNSNYYISYILIGNLYRNAHQLDHISQLWGRITIEYESSKLQDLGKSWFIGQDWNNRKFIVFKPYSNLDSMMIYEQWLTDLHAFICDQSDPDPVNIIGYRKGIEISELHVQSLNLINLMESSPIYEKSLLAFSDSQEGIERGNDHALFRLIEKYLTAHYREPISLNMLADTFNFHPSYINKIFRKYKDTTPIKFIIQLRIEEAKRLIAMDLSFKEIGNLVGYPDPAYFSRIFKISTGMTLSEYSMGNKSDHG